MAYKVKKGRLILAIGIFMAVFTVMLAVFLAIALKISFRSDYCGFNCGNYRDLCHYYSSYHN